MIAKLHQRCEYLLYTLNRNILVLMGVFALLVTIVSDLGAEWALLMASAICLGFVYKSRYTFWEKSLLVIVIIFTFGICRQSKTIAETDIRNQFSQKVTVRGVVAQQPILSGQKQRVVLKVNRLILETGELNQKGKLIFSLSKFSELEEGDEIVVQGTVLAGEVFEGFDYQEYLNAIGIDATLENAKLISRSENAKLLLVVSNFLRERIRSGAMRHLPQPHASLLIGMLIGSKEQFTADFEDNLSSTGTAHIIAVSGFNITLLIGLVMSVAGFVPRRVAFFACIGILILFLTIVGFQNLPALRAMIMGSITILGHNLGRKTNSAGVLLFSLAIMLWLNPLVYKSLSFQLSFAATLGLMTLADTIEGKLPKLLGEHIRSELGVTLAAILATFPITFASFGKLSLYAPLANLLVAPLVPVIMLAGFVMLVATFISDSLAGLVSILVWVPLDLMTRLINTVGHLPGADLLVSEQYRSIIALVVLAGVIVFAFESGFSHYRRVL